MAGERIRTKHSAGLKKKMENTEVSMVLRVEGGTADEGILDAYDAANTIYGLARGVNLVAHAFANNDEVRTKNQSAKGAKVFIHSSKKGCFEEQLNVVFDEKISKSVGPAVLTNAFWDYLSWTWINAIGDDYDLRTARVKRRAEKNDLFIYEIADALETPMQLMHRAITRDRSVKVYLNRPRVGDVLTLTSDTLDYVTVREVVDETEYIMGNVTRVNVLSQFGRLYSDEEGKVLSFSLANPDDRRVRGLSLKSMQQHNEGESGKVHLKVSKIVSGQGVVKRYIVHDILEIAQ